jgi:hypothetical protein
MYLYFHLEFKISLIHIFSKRKLVQFFFGIQQHLPLILFVKINDI